MRPFTVPGRGKFLFLCLFWQFLARLVYWRLADYMDCRRQQRTWSMMGSSSMLLPATLEALESPWPPLAEASVFLGGRHVLYSGYLTVV